MLTAGQAASHHVVIGAMTDRLQDHAAAITARRATHCVVFDDGQWRGVVRLRDAAMLSPLRILGDLITPCSEVDAGMPLIEIADEFLNPERDAFVVRERGAYVGLLTRESLLERLLAEQKAITAEREKIAAERAASARVLAQQIAEKIDEFACAHQETELFAHALSHNLRGTFARVHSFAEIMALEQNEFSEEARYALSRILASAQLGLEIVESARQFAETSAQPPPVEPVSLGDVCQQLAGQRGAEPELNGARLLVTQPMPVVLAHGARLYQVLWNLVENAAKFSPRNEGIIVIRAEVRGTVARLWVIDNGPGVPPDEVETIFRPFKRGVRAAGTAGSGIGLAFSRICLRQMNGAIGLESAPGEGSRFWVELPLAGVDRSFSSTAAISPPAAPGGGD